MTVNADREHWCGPRFHLVHRETGLRFGEYKSRHPLHYYSPNGREYTDSRFANIAVRAILRCDGAVGFQRLKPWYDEGELYFLKREEWIVQWKDEI